MAGIKVRRCKYNSEIEGNRSAINSASLATGVGCGAADLSFPPSGESRALHLVAGCCGRGLTLAIRLWHSAAGTVLLYGSAGLHFALALRTVHERRHWTLPLNEWIRLRGGLAALLVRHAVATRLAASLYGFEPDYTKIVVSLITSGTQGLQLALLAPGWVHGCLVLWIRFRHYPFVHRAKPAVIAVLVTLPSLSAAGFVQMTRAALTANALHLIPDPKLVAYRIVLDAWRHDLLTVHL